MRVALGSLTEFSLITFFLCVVHAFLQLLVSLAKTAKPGKQDLALC